MSKQVGSSEGEVTVLLRQIRAGDSRAQDRLAELIYAELRRIAAHRMRGERPDHTLTPTALANEAWLRLGAAEQDFTDRSHFFAIAAHAMRRVLIDHARARNAVKRGGDRRISVEAIDAAAPETDELLLALDEALSRLSDIDPRAARVVELRYFSGLTHTEIAGILGVDRRTIDRDWAMARAWLYAHVSEQQPLQ